MSQVNTNAIFDASGGQSAQLYGVSMRYGGTNFVNRIINGDMRIDQRNNGASVSVPANTTVFSVDRWNTFSTQASKFSMQQNAGAVTPPAGFTNYLGCTSLSAYSVTTSDFFPITQSIEGFNTADLGWGAAGAQAVTLSFWVRSSLTGTFGGVLQNVDNTRSYPFVYTISAANTWEQKTVTIAGDTSGTWNTGNDRGIGVRFSLGAGASRSGTAGAWAGSDFRSATGAVSVVGTSGATFYITGVQLEAGSVATPFERRPFGTELALCERYFQIVEGGYGGSSFAGAANAGKIYFRTVMRASATVTWTTALRNTGQWTVGAPAGFYMNTDQTKYAHPFKSASATAQDTEFWDRYNLSAEL